MTSISEDQTLPLGMENTLNQMELSKADSMATVNDVSTASDVSDPHYPVSGSPGTLSAGTGRLSPQRSRLMKDQEMQLSELKKDNFGLKLRIYHLEEALRKQMGNDSDDWRLSVDLNVTVDSLKKELREKNELLLKAKHAMDGMALQHESHLKKANEEFAARLAEEKRRLQMAILDRDSQAADLESAQEKQIQHLNDEIARLNKELDDVFNELAEKEDEVKALQESGAAVDPLRKETEELKAQLAETEDELKAVQDALQGKDKELEDLIDELNGKDKELEERNGELDQLKRELERAKSAAGQQAGAVAEQEVELDALRRKLEALQSEAQEAKELRAALRKKDGEVDALRDAVQDLEQELDGAKRDMTELVDDRKSVQDQYSQDLNDALADNDALKDQVQGLEAKLESLGPELSKRDAAIAKLQQALKEKEDQLAKQDQQLLDLSTRKAAEVGVLEKALADLRGVVDQQAEAEKDLKAQIGSLEEELEGLRKKVADQSTQIGQPRGPAHATDATDSDQLDDAESLRELHSQLESLRRRVGQKEAEVGRLEDELAHKDNTVRDLNEALKRARADSSAADKRRRDAEKEASELKDQLDALQRRLAEDREDSVDARTSVGSQTPPLVQGGHTMAELEAILSELRRLLEQLNARGRSKETTNYFNLSSSQQPAPDQSDLLERLLRVLSVDREPRIIQPSPVHVNVTVPPNQGAPIINVPASPQHQVTVTEGSPKLEVRHMMSESTQAVPVTERASQTLPLGEEEGQGAGRKLIELQAQNRETVDNLRRLKARLSAVEEDNGLLLQKNDELAGEREAILEENATLTDQSRSMEKLVRNLSQQVEELAREREKMVGKLQDAGEMISVLQDRLTALQQEAAEKEDLIVELRGRIGHLQGQVSVLGSQSARKDRKVPSRKEVGVGVGLSESEEEADLSGIYNRLKELQLENKKLKRGLTDESKLAADSQQEREAEMNSMQTKLIEAQEEIDQLRELARRSQTPDSRAATPFGVPPPHVAKEMTSTGVQTHLRRADKSVMVQLAPLQWDGAIRSPPKSGGGAGMQSGVQQSSTGVQHSPASTPPAPPLDASWPSTTSGGDERKAGSSWREDSRRAEDLSALDEQYQASLRLNQLVQQRIAQQLLGAGSGPGVTEKGTGTAPSAMVDHGTSPVAIPDPADALHSELAATQQQALLLAKQLQASQNTQQTKEGEVMRLHSKLVQSQSEMAALESQLDALLKEKNENITSLEKQRSTLLRKYKKAKSEIERMRVDLERAKVTEGVQAGPSVGEMSERSQKLEEDIDTMSSQLQATAASQAALLEELDLKEKETEQLMNHVASLTKELQVYQAAQSLLPHMGSRRDEVIQTDSKGEVPQQSLPADFTTLMSEVGQLRDKLDASIRSNRDLSKELKKKLKEPQVRLKAKTRATQVSAPSTASSGVDDTTTISSTALTSQHSQPRGSRPSGTSARKKEEKPVRPQGEQAFPLSASAPALHKGAEGSTPRASSFAGRPSNITFQHPAAYSTPYPHRLVYSDSDEPLMSAAYLPTGGAQHGGIPTPFPADKIVSTDRGTQHTGKDDKAVQHDGLGWGTDRHSRIPRPTVNASPAAAHAGLPKVSRGMQHSGAVSTGTQATGRSTVGVQSGPGHDRIQHSGVPPPCTYHALPLQRGAVASEGTQATLSSSVGVLSGSGAQDTSAQTSRVVSAGTQAVQYSSVGVGEPVESCDSTLTWSRVSAGVQSSPPHASAGSQRGAAEFGHQETLMKRKSSPSHRSPSHGSVQHSSYSHHTPPSHHTSLQHGSLLDQFKDVHYSRQSDEESSATFSTHASDAEQVVSVRSAVSQTGESGMSAAPLRVVQLKDALVQTAHSGCIQPCAALSETVLVDSAVGGDEGCSQVDKMIQTVQEAQKKLTHMLAVPELTVSDRKFLEELLRCLRQQQAELEEGRRLLSRLQRSRSPSRDASSQTSPLRSPASSSSSLAGRVLDLSDVYQQLLDTRGHTLASRDNLKKYHSRRGAQQGIQSEP